MDIDKKLVYTTVVTVEIYAKPVDKKWHVKWEPNIMKEINHSTFVFNTLDMETAMDKINYIVSVHPEKYFKSIIIKNGI